MRIYIYNMYIQFYVDIHLHIMYVCISNKVSMHSCMYVSHMQDMYVCVYRKSNERERERQRERERERESEWVSNNKRICRCITYVCVYTYACVYIHMYIDM